MFTTIFITNSLRKQKHRCKMYSTPTKCLVHISPSQTSTFSLVSHSSLKYFLSRTPLCLQLYHCIFLFIPRIDFILPYSSLLFSFTSPQWRSYESIIGGRQIHNYMRTRSCTHSWVSVHSNTITVYIRFVTQIHLEYI